MTARNVSRAATAQSRNRVRKFFRLYGHCREVQLADGTHAPIVLSVEQMDAQAIVNYARNARQIDDQPSAWARTPENAPALKIEYRGHREDLVALGCISSEALAGARYVRYLDDPRGAIFYLQSKAGPGCRGRIEITYWTQSRSFLAAAALPGVCKYCADWLLELTGRPRLRLVVDNTRATQP